MFDETEKSGRALSRSLRSIIKNPVIVAGIIAIIYSLIGLPIPNIIINTGKYLADITLPLALIGVGASLRAAFLRKTSLITIGATFIKLVIAPLVVTILGYLLGYSGMDLAIIFIIFACPTAIISYILADAMTPHGEIAGNIVITSTLISAVTIPLGLIILNFLNLI
jgi:predicted permease